MKEPYPISITLQLVDRSIAYPKDIVNDVLVTEEKFTFSANFVVLDIKENEDILIILGHPFLNTCDMVVEVR